jgi:hypothetical protein
VRVLLDPAPIVVLLGWLGVPLLRKARETYLVWIIKRQNETSRRRRCGS